MNGDQEPLMSQGGTHEYPELGQNLLFQDDLLRLLASEVFKLLSMCGFHHIIYQSLLSRAYAVSGDCCSRKKSVVCYFH